MLTSIQKTILYDQNAIYYDYSIKKLMEKAGQGIAKKILQKYGKNKKIAFFCGLGNNGADGFVTARYLAKNAQTTIFLLGSAKQIRTPEAQKNWELCQEKKVENVTTKEIKNHFDLIVDCLLGTGIKGKLRKKYQDIVITMNQLSGEKISIDLPTPGFKADFVISLMFPKTKNSAVVDINFPQKIKKKIGVGEIKILQQPNSKSHKGENGKLLIIGGSKKYHGAPLLAAKIASKIVDLIYFFSVPKNNVLIQEMKSKLCEFIAINQEEILWHTEQVKRITKSFEKDNRIKTVKQNTKTKKKHFNLNQINTILIGPGLDNTEKLGIFVNQLLQKYPKKKYVLDADALKYLNKKLLSQNVILTPHQEEFKRLFNLKANKENVFKIAKKYNCIIVLKGKNDYVASTQKIKINQTGNSGMTKGGTGDVLAGLIAALACQNDLFLAACAGVFLNGLAGEQLAKKVGIYFSASDLIEEIPKIIKWCQDFKRK